MKKSPIILFVLLYLLFSCEKSENIKYTCDGCCCTESDTGIFSTLEECWEVCLPKPNESGVIVTVFLYESCPIAQYMCGPIRDIYRYFCDTLNQDFVFRGFSPNSLSTPVSISDFIIEFDIPFNISTDYNHNENIPGSYTQNYLPTVTPEVFIELNGDLVYKGMINNSYLALGQQSAATENFLFDVLNDIVNQEEIVYFETDAIGCLINY